MAKKSRAKRSAVAELPDNMLPQNMIAVGDHVEENKNIYISQSVYKEIHKFTKNKTTNESGGMLVGSVIDEFGKMNIVISGFVEAKFCEATPTTLKFTHETWEYVHKEIERKHNGKKIVGWIHTHPDFGIFLSEYDKFIQQNFFSDEHQIAYVVDPIQHIEGFYFWINGNIEKCKGFYIYDKTGVEITVGPEKEIQDSESKSSMFSFKNILLAILSVAVVLLVFANISTSSKLKEIEKQQITLTNSANQSLAAMQQQIWSQSVEIQELQSVLKEAGIIVEPTELETDTTNSGESNDVIDNKSEDSNSQPDETSATDSNESDSEINSESATGSATEEGASE